ELLGIPVFGPSVDFDIIGSSNTADSEGFLPGSLTVSFGDIAPGASVSGYWALRASRKGFFIAISSSFTHQDYKGVQLDPLILPPTTKLIPAIGGNVTANGGFAVPNLTVTLKQGGSVKGNDLTDTGGTYYLRDLAAGNYVKDV